MSKLTIVSHFHLKFEEGDTPESILDQAFVFTKANNGNTTIHYRNKDICVVPGSNYELCLAKFGEIDKWHDDFKNLKNKQL